MFATSIKKLQANMLAVLRLKIRQRKLKIITVIAAKRLVPKSMTVSLLTGLFTLMLFAASHSSSQGPQCCQAPRQFKADFNLKPP